MATDKDKTVTPAGGQAPEPVYEVFGLNPRKGDGLYREGSIPMKIDGEDVDLATASQQQLKELFEAGKRFVRIAPAN